MPMTATITPIKQPTYSDYWASNLAVIPVRAPGFEWSAIYRENYRPSEDQLFEWDLADGKSFALLCGTPSNVVAIDLDHVTPEQIERVKKALGDSPCAKFGTKGLTLFYRYNGEVNYNWKKSGAILVELLSTGRLTTISPSPHRSAKGVHYKWVGQDLLSCHATLPSLPHDYIAKLNSILSVTPPPEKHYAKIDYDIPPSFDEAINALSFCNPDCSNDEWVQIGMALRSEIGDAAFHEFDNWSSSGKAYDKPSIYSRWRSFNSRSIGYGTLVYYAKQGGYKPPRSPERNATKTLAMDNWTAKKLENYARDVRESEKLPEFYTNAPHHIKLICDWIVSTARYPQPIITMGAVLSFLGFYMGSEFVYKGIKGNIYNINLARSTHGKEHILKCIRGLMRELDIEKLIGGSGATSDTAIFAKLQANEGKCVYLIDEFQGFMRVLSSKKSGNSREAGLTALLLKAYTSRVITSVDYADPSERETVTIRNPYMNLIGFCTPEPFFEAVGSAEAFNGLVGRLTIFEGAKILPQRNKNPQDDADLNIPPEIIRILKDIKSNRERIHHSDGSFGYALQTQILETDEAHTLIERINDEIDDKRREYDMDNSQMSLVIGRVFEIMKKYSLISSRGKSITVADITWAKSVADYNIGIMLVAASNITDSSFERKKQNVYEFILKRGGFITKTEFTNNCKIFETRKEREEVIADLIDAGRIEIVKIENTGGKPKTGYQVPQA